MADLAFVLWLPWWRKVTGIGQLFEGSFSGMVTTNEGKGDALWFWFLPAQSEHTGTGTGTGAALCMLATAPFPNIFNP